MKFILIFTTASLCLTSVFAQNNIALDRIDMLLFNEDYMSAISELNKIIEEDSSNSNALYKLGLAYQGNYQNSKAIPILQKAISLDSSTGIMLSLAKSYYNLGYPDKAEQIYSSIYKTDSTSKTIAINFAKILLDNQKYMEAQKIYNNLLSQDSSDSYLYKQLAYSLMKSDSLELSLKYYLRTLDLYPEDANSAVQMAAICSKLGRQDSALQYVDYGLSYFPDDCNFNRLKADILFKKGDYKSAIDYYTKVISLGDSSVFVFQNLGYSYYFFGSDEANFKESKTYLKDKNETYTNALNAFEKSYSLGNENHLLCYYTGLAADKINEQEIAIFFYNEAIKRSVPAFIDKIYKFLGYDYQLRERYDESIEAYKEALFYDPDCKELLFDIGIIYSEKLKDSNEAIKYLQSYLDSDDNKKPGLKPIAEAKLKKLILNQSLNKSDKK